MLYPERRKLVHEPVFTVPTDLLREHRVESAEHYADQPDPYAEAVSLNKIHVSSVLTSDNGDC